MKKQKSNILIRLLARLVVFSLVLVISAILSLPTVSIVALIDALATGFTVAPFVYAIIFVANACIVAIILAVSSIWNRKKEGMDEQV